VKGAPATNNGVENYYSTSLKTHRKKQLRTDKGIENQMKLSAMKRTGLLGKCKKTLLEVFLMFWIRIMWIFDRKSMWDHFMVVYYLQTR